MEAAVINVAPSGRHLGECDVTKLGGEAGRRQGRGRLLGRLLSQQWGPKWRVKGTDPGLRAWWQVGTSQRQMRPSRQGESESTGAKQPVTNPGGRWLLEVWKFGAGRNLHVYHTTDTQGGSE